MQGSRREGEQAVRSGAERLVESDAGARLWRRDASLWAEDAEPAAKVENRLGWLTSLDAVDPEVLREFVSEVRAAGFRRVLLLGMGGSSLCPEVLRQCFGGLTGSPKEGREEMALHVMNGVKRALESIGDGLAERQAD